MCYDKLLGEVAPYIALTCIGTIDGASRIIVRIYIALGVGIVGPSG
jgi:hypothetical protein